MCRECLRTSESRHYVVQRFRGLNHMNVIHQPHPEERALARVSKDGSRRGPCRRPSFETAARRARPPQDEVVSLSSVHTISVGWAKLVPGLDPGIACTE